MRGVRNRRIIHAIMREAVDRMTTALRVLAAVVYGFEVDEADIHALHRMAPFLSATPLDELACFVIRQAVERAEERRAGRRGWAPDGATTCTVQPCAVAAEPPLTVRQQPAYDRSISDTSPPRMTRTS